MGTDVLARCDCVSRVFGSGRSTVTALDGVTCEVRAGELIAVTGPSGSGKSTLLHLLAGLDRPTSGSLSWPALGLASALRPASVAVVFQGPSLLPPLDTLENVGLPLLLMGASEADARQQALHALERVGAADLADRLPEELSGGQAQRAAVARALAGRPRLLLADEPTGQLDHAAGGQVIALLIEAARSLGAALVISTHDARVAGELPVRWRMRHGLLEGAG
jgi:putative ABC transport system ATP-binding protein